MRDEETIGTTAKRRRAAVFCFSAAMLLLATALFGGRRSARAQDIQNDNLLFNQTQADADRKSSGCVSCHVGVDEPTMHTTGTVRLGCVDCHTGDASVAVTAGTKQGSAEYENAKAKAHSTPKLPWLWKSSANPVRAYTDWLRENPEYIQFVNPGDLRVADKTCGRAGCHAQETYSVRTSMMATGGILWGAALYNNGAFPLKDEHFGESYAADGTPLRIKTYPPPAPEETLEKGIMPFEEPLERWEISQPGNVLRVFERGGEEKSEIGNPNRLEEPGKPDDKLSFRGFGTQLRTDPVFLGLQKTRLLDPTLNMPGTNDQPGDYRASGCSACHVVYANDRSAAHSMQYAKYGNMGASAESDPTIPRGQPGHPIKHAFTLSMPSSQCMVCHVHPGTNMMTTFYGDTWWDNEVDGKAMYPAQQHNPTEEERYRVGLRNPEAAAPRGLWASVKFLAQTGTAAFNKELRETQFDDFHGHGWIFRQVEKHDREGNLLDANNRVVPFNDPEKFGKAVHLQDLHLEKGMQCVDCHFAQDAHGTGKLYNEPRAAIAIHCTDCHGTIREKSTLVTSGPASPEGGINLAALRTPWGEREFYWQDGKLFQRSMMQQNLQWEVTQVLDTITPGNPHYNEKSRLAKTIRTDGATWGDVPASDAALAHPRSSMTCFACHSSWTPNCFGCHLQMTANNRRKMLHNEGTVTRNWTSYNFQVLRDDAYMLAIDGTVTGHRVAPARSSCAILVSSQNANRDWLYYTQQTVSAPGFSGQAFSTYVPHTVRATETKQCTDCHVSSARDNNAWMAQVLLLGTNFLNYEGRYIYVAEGNKGFAAVAVAEHDDPDTIYGSDFQSVAYPDDYKKFVTGRRRLSAAYHHEGKNILSVQMRGEYVYAAMGAGGFRVFDIANVDNKGFSEKIVTAPVSPLGQRLYVKTKYATDVATPTTLAVDPTRTEFAQNQEQRINLMYGFLYVTDKYEGLIVVGDPNLKGKAPGVSTLLNGNPEDNFLKRAVTFNPGGILNGARRIAIAGTYAYILCDKGLAVVDLNNPLAPRVVAQIGAPELNQPRGIAIQFRYAFVVDRDGLKVLDVTQLDKPRVVPNAAVPFVDARNVYVARTYAYVSAGSQGLAIVNVERPEHPVMDGVFNAGGAMNDVNDVKLGATAASIFAYVADGKNGVRVVQLIAPENDPRFEGFSPRPMPKLVATYRTAGPALAVSKGIDRDRAVDESGNQIAVFGRRGARPFNLEEMQRMYLRDGKLYTVTDAPPGKPQSMAVVQSAEKWIGGWLKKAGGE
ncbi:MAG: hypothetical protein ACHQJX_06220 [Candidatus Acidiferrales bacterium]